MDEGYVTEALSPLRKVIATRMAEAKVTVPHFRLVADIEVDALHELRMRARGRDETSDLTLNDLLIKACAAALLDVPAMNIQWVDGAIRRYARADIAVVVNIDGGLTTPIVRSADSKTVWEISREMKSLVTRAEKGGLMMQEVFGGTFSISNLGMYGVDQFDAIVNPPQCAILAVGRAKSRCTVSEQREIRVASVMRVTLSVDHRALDGVTAARFLASLRSHLEHPEPLLAGGA